MPLSNAQVCDKIGSATWRVVILNAEPPYQLVSFGTAFAVSPTGLLLTARHVISDGKRHYSDPIVCLKNQTQELRLFRPITAPDLSIDTGAKETRPFTVDLASLTPLEPLNEPCPYLPLRREMLEIGDDVIVAGYAKDITYPFLLDEHINTETFEGMDMKAKLRRSYGLRQLFFKKTMIGARWTMKLNGYPRPGTMTLAAQYIYGTDLIEGGSGGPVVDFEGRIAAVVARRGVTKLESYEISTTDGRSLATLPAGSGTAFSHNLVTSMFSATDQFYA